MTHRDIDRDGWDQVQNLYSRSPTRRLAVLEGLCKQKHTLARLAAQALASDPNVDVRMRAVELLGEVGTRSDLPRLLDGLRDAAWSVRASAADSLGLLGGRRAWSALCRAMTEDQNANVRRYAAVALASGGRDIASGPLAAALRDERNPSALVGIYSALYDLGDAARLAELLDLLHHRDTMVRFQVLAALDDLRPQDVPRAVAALQALLAREECLGVVGNARALLATLEARMASFPPDSSTTTAVPGNAD